MKKTVFFAGLLCAALALGITFTGCNLFGKNNCANGENCQATYGGYGGTTCGASKCNVQNGKTGPSGTTVYCNCGD
ncbi:MAG: hypothetical protein Ta2A_01090 [Treponemataceae bacterium]|nr:MAG: hypothetical protein Ta2A_01090 [Treponemataceae bacterium]